MKPVVIVPTYNERDIIDILLHEILSLPVNLSVINVDDNSPDGTGEAADAWAGRYPNRVQVVHRAGKVGLGTAYIAGFKHAFGSDFDRIMSMDADFSHHPRYIPSMLDLSRERDRPRLDHEQTARLARYDRVILLCGRYEGVDERVREGLVDEELSVGDFVVTGGEIPALLVLDAVARLVPGVLGNRESAAADSFAEGRLDHPHWTRPAEYLGLRVPEVLLSGDHEAVRRWREERSWEATRAKRPDLIQKGRG